MKKTTLFSLLVLSTLSKAQLSTERINQVQTSPSKLDDTIYVIGTKDSVFTQPGSAHVITNEELETFNHSDVGRVLDKTPGVYIQEEDGLGLRPNIGMRGAHPHRSKKVTIMEDGILVGPSPYSSPAAYYFPNMARAHNVEVFKGPSSVRYGPNSIGGAINMVTTPMGQGLGNKALISFGPIEKLELMSRGENIQFEAYRIQTDGFKNLPSDDPTGMERNDFMLKFAPLDNWQLKLELSNEESHETYMGVSESDFNSSPYNRYAASQDDLMQWQRYALQIRNKVELTKNTQVNTTFYHHRMSRSWNKFVGINNGDSVRDVLLNPSAYPTSYNILTGASNSQNAAETLTIGDNDREYLSQGIQTKLNHFFSLGESYHDLNIGLRAHNDYVDRNHTEINAFMQAQDLIYDQASFRKGSQVKDEARALTAFIEDEINYGKLILMAGARAEYVESISIDPEDPNNNSEYSENAFVPGISMNYSFSDQLSVLAGVNKGLVIVGPGQDPGVQQEESINYEAGFRYRNRKSQVEAIAFYSDYQNIKGVCSFSSGCAENNLDIQFNGGKAEVYGLEALANHRMNYQDWVFPIGLSYTFTVARFTGSIQSDNPEWGVGQIQEGDPLPYIPQDTWNAKIQAIKGKWRNSLSFLWKGRMADQSVATGREIIPAYGVIDWGLDYQYSKKTQLFAGVNNLLDNEYLVSLRPFGARPGLPRTFRLGLSHQF